MIGRRPLASAAALLWLLARSPARAQPAKGLPRVARIRMEVPLADIVGPDPVDPGARAFVHGLRDLGWVDGRNVTIVNRSAEGRPERLPALLREVIERPVDVIVTAGGAMSRAARQATDTTPIVAIGPDLVALGLASSLARPGGNVTGLTFESGPAMAAKRLQLLKRAVPTVKRVTYIRPSPVPGQPMWSAETAEAARALGLVLSAAVPLRAAAVCRIRGADVVRHQPRRSRAPCCVASPLPSDTSALMPWGTRITRSRPAEKLSRNQDPES